MKESMKSRIDLAKFHGFEPVGNQLENFHVKCGSFHVWWIFEGYMTCELINGSFRNHKIITNLPEVLRDGVDYFNGKTTDQYNWAGHPIYK